MVNTTSPTEVTSTDESAWNTSIGWEYLNTFVSLIEHVAFIDVHQNMPNIYGFTP